MLLLLTLYAVLFDRPSAPSQQAVTTYAMHVHSFVALQMALQRTVYWMADGLISGCVLKLVVAVLRADRVASLHLPMAAKIVQAMRLRRVTRKFAQVRLVGVGELGCS